MNDDDRLPFAEMIADVYLFYRRGRDDGKVSEFDLSVWWTTMRPFDLAAVKDALGRHAMNPDTGQFRPMPADVVKMIGGTTKDAALIAWSKFETALLRIGQYRSVAFDDALIHRVIDEMGGWVHLASTSSKDWPFRQNEFVNRYRGYRMRSEMPPFPPRLIGIAEGENTSRGFYLDDAGQKKLIAETVLVGDPGQAAAVIAAGSELPRLALTPMGALTHRALEKLESKA